MMNSPFDAQGKPLTPPVPVPAKTAVRLEYRMIAEEELELEETGSSERRRTERRRHAGPPPIGTGLSDEALQQALKAASAEGMRRGEREGRERARAEMEAELAAAKVCERERMKHLLDEFAQSKRAYFAEIEGQVVRLALAIAARVLHRETQMDAMVMAGAVHVVLEKLADRSGVILRTPPADVAAWQQSFADVEDAPRVVGDATLTRGECMLETTMGTVELGVETQMEEIEHGFFDLLRSNPLATEKVAA